MKQTEEMGKADASPVTVADFGAQAVVAYTLQDSLRDVKVSLVAEEDASAIRHVTLLYIAVAECDGLAVQNLRRCEDVLQSW